MEKQVGKNDFKELKKLLKNKIKNIKCKSGEYEEPFKIDIKFSHVSDTYIEINIKRENSDRDYWREFQILKSKRYYKLRCESKSNRYKIIILGKEKLIDNFLKAYGLTVYKKGKK